MNKVGNINKEIFILNDSVSNFEVLLQKTGNCTIQAKILRILTLDMSFYEL